MKMCRGIRIVEEWFRFASPKGGEDYWVDGRGARELAKAWLAREHRQCHRK